MGYMPSAYSLPITYNTYASSHYLQDVRNKLFFLITHSCALAMCKHSELCHVQALRLTSAIAHLCHRRRAATSPEIAGRGLQHRTRGSRERLPCELVGPIIPESLPTARRPVWFSALRCETKTRPSHARAHPPYQVIACWRRNPNEDGTPYSTPLPRSPRRPCQEDCTCQCPGQ